MADEIRPTGNPWGESPFIDPAGSLVESDIAPQPRPVHPGGSGFNLPSISDAGYRAIAEMEAANKFTSSMMPGGKDPSRLRPFKTADTGSFAYLAVGMELNMTQLLNAIVGVEAYAGESPGILLKKHAALLKLRIQKYTPEGEFREYNDPYAKHVSAGAFFGEAASSFQREKVRLAIQENHTRSADQIIDHEVRRIYAETEKLLRTSGLKRGHPLLKSTTGGQEAGFLGTPTFKAGRTYERFTTFQKKEMMREARAKAQQIAARGTTGVGSERMMLAKGEPSGALIQSIETRAVFRTGAAFLYASSLVYYAYFVEHGAMRVLKPMIQGTWFSGGKHGAALEEHRHDYGAVTELPVYRLGYYDKFKQILEARAAAFAQTKHPTFNPPLSKTTGQPWISFQPGSGYNKPVRMFEKGIDHFMRDEMGPKMWRQWTRGFQDVWTGKISSRTALMRLAGAGRMQTLQQMTHKTGQVTFRDPITKQFRRKPGSSGIDADD